MNTLKMYEVKVYRDGSNRPSLVVWTQTNEEVNDLLLAYSAENEKVVVVPPVK